MNRLRSGRQAHGSELREKQQPKLRPTQVFISTETVLSNASGNGPLLYQCFLVFSLVSVALRFTRSIVTIGYLFWCTGFLFFKMPAESENSKSSNSFYWEESTVTINNAADDLVLFRKYCKDLRDLIHTTWVQKQAGEKISSAKFASLILSLKELNRKTQFRIRKARDRTSEQKLNVDKLHLGLQNLLYEVAHLENEIKTCLEFKSQHEKLCLIPIEEFFLATGRQSDAALSHEETLERLYWELDQRKNWSASCQKLVQSVESVSQEIAQKRKYLESFAPKLKELVDNTLVIQKLMNLPFSKEEEQHQFAFLLPTPLYILYSHLKSYLSTLNCLPQISVEIEGDGELARAVNQAAAASRALGIGLSPDADESDLDDMVEEKKRKKRRKGDVSGHPPSHPSNKAFSLHPLRVVLRLAYPCDPSVAHLPSCGAVVCEKPQIQLTLSFAWIAHLSLVTVRMRIRPTEPAQQHQQQPSSVDSSVDHVDCAVPRSVSGNELLRSESLLLNLCPTRTCSDSVTEDAPALPPGLLTASVQWNACESIGRPYLWAQQLCGLVPLPEQEIVLPGTFPDAGTLESGYESARFGHLDLWLKALTQRLANRISLLRELATIEAGRPVLSKEQLKLVPRVVDVRLTNWKRSSMAALENVPRARKLIALKLIHSSDIIFQCEFYRPDYVPIPVWVAVPPEYPERAPVFVVHNPGHETSIATRAKNRTDWELSDLNLQDLEAEVNCYWTEFFTEANGTEYSEDSESTITVRNILSCQLVRCAVCLQALSSGDSVMLEPSRTVRYPTRSYPLRYLPSLGLFTHR